jgi:hypothetical protein
VSLQLDEVLADANQHGLSTPLPLLAKADQYLDAYLSILPLLKPLQEEAS